MSDRALTRTAEQWAKIDAAAVSTASPAHIKNLIIDAQEDLAALGQELFSREFQLESARDLHRRAELEAKALRARVNAAHVRHGHGHVTPNPDGFLARCGGPSICKVCKAELAAIKAPAADAITDSDRLVFMLAGHRKVIVECLPRRGYSVYVEQGFMGEFRYPAISFKGDSWENDSDEAQDLKRKAIDAALAAYRAQKVE